jgi:hypothetical protein
LLRQVIDGRLSRLDPEVQRLLTVGAVVGHVVPLTVWAAVAAVDEARLVEVVETGLEARLLVETAAGDRVQFAHALVREAIYAGIAAARDSGGRSATVRSQQMLENMSGFVGYAMHEERQRHARVQREMVAGSAA